MQIGLVFPFFFFQIPTLDCFSRWTRNCETTHTHRQRFRKGLSTVNCEQQSNRRRFVHDESPTTNFETSPSHHQSSPDFQLGGITFESSTTQRSCSQTFSDKQCDGVTMKVECLFLFEEISELAQKKWDTIIWQLIARWACLRDGIGCGSYTEVLRKYDIESVLFMRLTTRCFSSPSNGHRQPEPFRLLLRQCSIPPLYTKKYPEDISVRHVAWL